jgi:acetyl-CoA synthetase
MATLAFAPPSLESVRQLLGLTPGQSFNLGALCADRHCALGRGARTAMIWEGAGGQVRRFSFEDLRTSSNGFAHRLAALGVQPGDRVCLLLDKVPELYFAILGILKLGAVAQPVFSQFMSDALESRLEDAQTRAAVVSQRHVGKLRSLRARLPALRDLLIVDAGERSILEPGESAFDLERERRDRFIAYPATEETPSLLHYTSGTTGKPKGAQHVHGSVLSQALTGLQVLDLRPDDIYWCTADPGWVTGTSYGILAPWALGTTQVILDAGFTALRWYEVLARHRVTVFYTAPTAVRMLMKAGDALPAEHDLSALRHLCSVGEPLNAAAVAWSERVLGKPFHDTFWQTETGAIMIANTPGLPIKPGSMGRPLPQVTAAILDLKTHQPLTTPGEVGLIAFKPPWPSMFRAYFRNEAAYRGKFEGEWYLTGDRGSVDADGYYWFVGRDDDVINTAGHLVGPFEVESALLKHPAVAESAAVSKPDPVFSEVVKAFVTLKPGFTGGQELSLELMNFVRKEVSPVAMPHEIEFVASLPKTRSGKIMRRVLRAQEWNEPVGDLSALDDG